MSLFSYKRPDLIDNKNQYTKCNLCDAVALDNLSYCLNHICPKIGCNGDHKCVLHVCEFPNCNELIYDDAWNVDIKCCKKHKCSVYKCKNTVYTYYDLPNVLNYCKSCVPKCSYTDCPHPAEIVLECNEYFCDKSMCQHIGQYKPLCNYCKTSFFNNCDCTDCVQTGRYIKDKYDYWILALIIFGIVGFITICILFPAFGEFLIQVVALLLEIAVSK